MRVEFRRRLHRDQREQLKQMVRHHVAQRAGGVVEAAAMADADLFIDRDLHMVDVIAVPDRLEHAVGEAQHQDVLHRFLAEVMIDPVDLVFGRGFSAIRRSAPWRRQGRCRTAFPPPAAARRRSLPSACRCGRVRLADRGKGGGWRRQIEQAVAAGRAVRLQPLQPCAHRIERGRVLRIGLDAGDAFQKTPWRSHRLPGGSRIGASPSSGCRAMRRLTCPCGRCRPRRIFRATDRPRRDYRARG